MRMLMGVLAGQRFPSRLFGDASLSRRPMKRVAEPLEAMGAKFTLTNGSFAPLTVHGAGTLKAIEYRLKVASAQVKSAILLAALYADGRTRLTGEIHSRDHTERLLPHFGAAIETSRDAISIAGGQELHGARVDVPGDPSSAAFWLAAASVVSGGHVTIENILLNPTRTGFIEALKRMGAPIREREKASVPEPVGEIELSHARLKGVTISAAEVPSLIDEIPVLAVLATYAEGTTEVRGAEELRVKETDRIEAVATNLRKMGARIETFEDGFRIEGPQRLQGAKLDSFHDHRIAMAFSIAALGAEGETEIANAESVSISYPTFFETLERLTGGH
jgi:3-phosphoshikimate 1-carboxyvinyltransferase